MQVSHQSKTKYGRNTIDRRSEIIKKLNLSLKLVKQNINNKESIGYRNSLISFKLCIQEQFCILLEVNKESYFFKDLFNLICLKEFDSNLKHYLVLIKDITTLDFGPKYLIANLIYQDITGISLPCDDEDWELLEDILKWIIKYCNVHSELFVSPLKLKIESWFHNGEEIYMVGALKYMSILFKISPSFIRNDSKKYNSFLIESLISDSKKVRTQCFRTIDIYKTFIGTKLEESFYIFCSEIATFFSKIEQLKHSTMIDVVISIVSSKPSLSNCFKFNPNFYLNCVNDTSELVIFKVFCLLYRCTPELFCREYMLKIFEKYSKCIQKSSSLRNSTLKALGNFCFLTTSVIHNFFPKELKELGKLLRPFSIINTKEDLSYRLYAYLSILNPLSNEFNKKISKVLRYNIDELISKGLLKIIKLYPDNSHELRIELLKKINSSILNSRHSDETVVLLVKILIEMKLNEKELKDNGDIPQYFILLKSSHKQIRYYTAQFLTCFQHTGETVSEMLLCYISYETDEQYRFNIFKKIKLYNENSSSNIITLLISLANDFSSPISISAVNLLCKINNSDSLLKHYIENFLIFIEKLDKYIDRSFLQKLKILMETKYHLFSKCNMILNTLLNFKYHNKHSLIIINILFKSGATDFDFECVFKFLCKHLDSYMSLKKLRIVLDIFNNAINYVHFLTYIRNDYLPLIKRLISLSNRYYDLNDSVLEILTRISVINADFIQPLVDNYEIENDSHYGSFKIVTTNKDPIISFTYASVYVSISTLLEIIGDESLLYLHVQSFSCLLEIFDHYQDIGDSIADHFIDIIHKYIVSGGPSSKSVIIRNFHHLVEIFENKIIELIPDFLKLLISGWKNHNKLHVLNALKNIIIIIPISIIDDIKVITHLIADDVLVSPPEIVEEIFSLLQIYEKLINIVDYIVFPVFFEYTVMNITETSHIAFITQKLQVLITYYTDFHVYGNTLINFVFFSYKNNKDLKDIILSFLCTLLIKYEAIPSSILSEIICYLPCSDNDCLNIVINSYIRSESIPNHIQNKYTNFPKEFVPKRWSHGFRVPRHKNSNVECIFSVQYPDNTFTSSDWDLWFQSVTSFFIQTSSSKAISLCYKVINTFSSIQNKIFPVAFALSIIESRFYNEVTSVLDVLKNNHSVPNNIARTIFSSLELLEISGAVLPLYMYDLATISQRIQLNIQSLRYKEYLLEKNSINNYNSLEKSDNYLSYNYSLNGIIVIISKDQDYISSNISSISAIEKDLVNNMSLLMHNPGDISINQACMTCMSILCRFIRLKDFSMEANNHKFMLLAAWGLGDIDGFRRIIKFVKKDFDTLYYFAIDHFLDGNYDESIKLISKIKSSIVDDILPLNHRFSVCFPNFINSLLLTELEELILLKQDINVETILSSWEYRFEQLNKYNEIEFFKILLQRSLYYNSKTMKEIWKDYLLKVTKIGMTEIFDIIIKKLDVDDVDVKFIYAKNEHRKGNYSVAFEMAKTILSQSDDSSVISADAKLHLSEWYLKAKDYKNSFSFLNQLKSEELLTFKAKERYSSVLYKLISKDNFKSEKQTLVCFNILVSMMSHTNSLVFLTIHKLFTILFESNHESVYKAFRDNISNVRAENWSIYFQQIASKLGSKENLDEILLELIFYVAEINSNLVLQRFSFLKHLNDERRKSYYFTIIQKLNSINSTVVKAYEIFREGLIESSSTYFEVWHRRINEISKEFMKNNDMEKASDQILQVHESTSTSKNTFYHIAFKSKFSPYSKEAYEHIKKYKINKNPSDFHYAWQIYIKLFHILSDFFSNIKSLNLNHISPRLYTFSSKHVTVPGTNGFSRHSVGIQSIDPVLRIFFSKQKPKKINIIGTNGVIYSFLLKANEDTRIDQHVMQLFDYVNLISHLACITTYSVLPLTHEVGLIGWVNNCSTLYDLIKQYRERNGVDINLERDELYRLSPTYDSQPVYLKQEIFTSALSINEGKDLKNIILINSTNSNHWIMRRNLYTKTLSSYSIIGYILGLGDRHLGNIMMNNDNASLIHIDFNDCFEVTRTRTQFPEKVPFRLTRMLVNALEFNGISGNFLSMSVNVMESMRSNKELMQGLIETFLFDPLIKFSCYSHEEPPKPENIIQRIKNKLLGKEYNNETYLSSEEQIKYLVDEATSTLNLCQMYEGWRPWW